MELGEFFTLVFLPENLARTWIFFYLKIWLGLGYFLPENLARSWIFLYLKIGLGLGFFSTLKFD
jgi:hypothetical protein